MKNNLDADGHKKTQINRNPHVKELSVFISENPCPNPMD